MSGTPLRQNTLLQGWEIGLCRSADTGRPAAQVTGVGGASASWTDAELGRHILFLGGIGTGKTTAITSLVSNLRDQADRNDVFIIFDTKGDYYRAHYRAGDAVLAAAGSVDQGQEIPGLRHWNVFRDLPMSDDPRIQAQEVAELAGTVFAGAVEEGAERGSIFPLLAQDLFAALMSALIREEGESWNNERLRAVIDASNPDVLRDRISHHPDLLGAAQYIAGKSGGSTQSVMVNLQQTMRSTFEAGFATAGDFSVRDFIRAKSGRALFIEYDIGAGVLLESAFRVIIDIALKESLSRNRAPGRVFLVLDEFSLLPHLRYIDSALNFGRSLGLRLVVGTQNVGQVHGAYGPAKAQSILSAFGTVFAFQLYDEVSRHFVRQRFGENTRLLRIQAAVAAQGLSDHVVRGNVVEDWDLSSLAVGETIAALPDRPPFWFKFRPA